MQLATAGLWSQLQHYPKLASKVFSNGNWTSPLGLENMLIYMFMKKKHS